MIIHPYVTISFIADDSSDNDIPDTPPSPTYGTPFTETTLSTQRPPVASGALRRRVMVLAPGQPIPYGRPDSSSSSSSKTSSDSSEDALYDFASSRSSSDHSLPTPSSGMRPIHHLCSLVPSIHRSPASISDRPSHDSSSISPSHNRSRSPAASVPSPELATDLKGCSEDSFEPYVLREAGLGVDFEDESSEPSRSRGIDLKEDVDVARSDGIDTDPKIQAEIDEFEAVDQEEIETSMRGLVEVRLDQITHPMVADDTHEPTQEGAVEVTYETLGDLVQRFHDHTEEILVHRVQAIESVQRDQGHRIVATGQQYADMLKRIREMERDNMRIRDMMDVEAFGNLPNTRSGASRTREGVNEQIDRRLAGALGARDAAKNLKPLIGDGGEQGEVNGNGGNGNRENGSGGNGNGGANGNGNGNGGGNGYNFRGFVHVARECTYQDFLKCQPLRFNGTEGVVGLTRWFEKMEMVFHISNCLEKYQL
ncbi:hypothetical protein Tco_1445137, partial [Tanacetum coccineum]